MIIHKNIAAAWKTKTGIYAKFKKPVKCIRIELVENPEKKKVFTDPVMQSIRPNLPDYFVTAEVEDNG